MYLVKFGTNSETRTKKIYYNLTFSYSLIEIGMWWVTGDQHMFAGISFSVQSPENIASQKVANSWLVSGIIFLVCWLRLSLVIDWMEIILFQLIKKSTTLRLKTCSWHLYSVHCTLCFSAVDKLCTETILYTN